MPQIDRDDSLTEVWEHIADQAPLRSTLDLIAQRVSASVGFDFCAVILPVTQDWERLRLAGSFAFPSDYSDHLSTLYATARAEPGSPTQVAARTGELRVVEDVEKDPQFAPWREFGPTFGYASLVSAPLTIKGRVIGVLNGYCHSPRIYSRQDLASVVSLASQAAIAVEMATMIESQVQAIADLRQANAELEYQRQLEHQARAIHDKLTDAAVAGADIPEIIRVLSELTDRPACFVTHAGMTSAIAGADEQKMEQFVAGVVDHLGDRTDANDRQKSEVLEDHRAIVGYVRVGSELIGFVISPMSPDGHHDLDRRAVEHAVFIIALESVRQRIALATEERLNADFLMDLVTGRGGTLTRLEERARYHGLSPDSAHRVMVVELDGWDAYLRREQPSSRAADQLLQRLLSAISTSAREGIPGCLVSHVGDRVTIAAPVEPSESSIERFEAAFRQMLGAIKRIAPTVGLHSGLGAIATRLDGLEASHRGAFEALTVLQRIGRTNQFLAAEQLGVIGLLLASSRPEDLRHLARQIIDPIAEKDRESGGALLETLFCYLDNDLSLPQTAARLYVHVNTVKYRLRRLQQLFGIDTVDPRQLVELTIAQMVHRLENPARGPGAD